MNESSAGPPPDPIERDVDEELRLHIELQEARYRRAGLPPGEARRLAARRFGEVERVRTTVVRRERSLRRQRRVTTVAGALWRDGREAARSVRRTPALAVAVVGALALAIGVATSLLTIVNELVLRPVPGLHRADLVKVYVLRQGELDGLAGHAYPAFKHYAAEARGLSHVTAFNGRGLAVSTGGASSLVLGILASGQFFETLGTRPSIGRLLGPADDAPGAAPVAVVSHAWWQDAMGGDPAVIGRAVRINGRDYEIVGVTEPGFRGPFIGFPSDLFVPLQRADHLAPDLDLDGWADGALELLGALAPDVSLAVAQGELSQITDRLATAHPAAFDGRRVSLRRWAGLDADLVQPVLGFVSVLSALAVLLALVAFVNVSGLLLHRGQARRTEFAIRQALGAGRLTLGRQLAIETLLLFAAALVVGLLIAGTAARGLLAFLPDFAIPIQLTLAVDWRVLGLASALTLAAALLFGVAPGVAATRVGPSVALKPTSTPPRRTRLRRLLVAAQFAASLVLLVTAGLFARSLADAGGEATGLEAAGIAVASADVRITFANETDGRRYFETWQQRVAAHPMVSRTALATVLPLSLGMTTTGVRVEGRAGPDGGHRLVSTIVTPEYFDTVGVRLVRGRLFDATDRRGAEPVAVVSEATAERLFGTSEPIGAYVTDDVARLRIVGVVTDVAVGAPGDLDTGHYYLPWAQRYSARVWLLARSPLDPPLDVVRDAATETDPGVPLLRAGSLAGRTAERLFAHRMAAVLAAAFGGVGALLAMVGLYGVVAFQTAQRRREFGIRVALGADRRGIRRMVLADGLRHAFTGIAAGLVVAWWLGVAIAGLVPGVAAADPVVFVAGAAALLVAALVAADLPARRAASADPMTTLRRD